MLFHFFKELTKTFNSSSSSDKINFNTNLKKVEVAIKKNLFGRKLLFYCFILFFEKWFILFYDYVFWITFLLLKASAVNDDMTKLNYFELFYRQADLSVNNLVMIRYEIFTKTDEIHLFRRFFYIYFFWKTRVG